MGGAVDEILRYVSPVIWMRRSVTRDCTLNGRDYREGDKALLFYWAANRDEAVFAHPERFDISRSPNPHVAFGGAGPHFCLGAHLARREITAMLGELLTRVPTSARRRARPAAVQLHQRHQAPALRLRLSQAAAAAYDEPGWCSAPVNSASSRSSVLAMLSIHTLPLSMPARSCAGAREQS